MSVDIKDYIDLVKNLDRTKEYTTTMSIIIQLLDKIDELDARLKILESK